MGKIGKAKKRRLALSDLPSATHTSPSSPDANPTAATSFLAGLITPHELSTTIRTLRTLSTNKELLGGAKGDLKGLRGGVMDFLRISNELSGTGASLPSRISLSLSLSPPRHLETLILLMELKLRGQTVKLGTLQRWVRECDATATLSTGIEGKDGEGMSWKVLEAILRCVEPEVVEGAPSALLNVAKEGITRDGIINRYPAHLVRELSGEDLWERKTKGTLFSDEEERSRTEAGWRLLQSTPGALRLPPNHHPANLYTLLPSGSSDHPLLSNLAKASCESHPIPNVPAAFLISDVLTLEECEKIVKACESKGFEEDEPVDSTAPLGGSVLAHNLYWFADKLFLDTIWSRIRECLPAMINGGQVKGLNARFRVYRYVPGAIYRPHIDGAWPASGLDPVTGEYLYDSSPADKPQWSRLTFLLYLNDSFPSGSTTFFLPTPSPMTGLNAFPVKPIAGSALVFPHGDTRGSLLHEGSPVGLGGGKYVIRTDVLYEVVKKGGRGEGMELE